MGRSVILLQLHKWEVVIYAIRLSIAPPPLHTHTYTDLTHFLYIDVFTFCANSTKHPELIARGEPTVS